MERFFERELESDKWEPDFAVEFLWFAQDDSVFSESD